MTITLHVCSTCRAGETPEDGQPVPGARLHAALAAAVADPAIRVLAVECLSACSAGCAVALSAPGRWTYVYGRLGDGDCDAILDGARRYAAAADGIVPWRERPEIFRKQSIARIPPLEEPTR